MKIAIRNIATQELLSTYEAEAPNQAGYGGAYGDPSVTEHVQYEPTDAEKRTANFNARAAFKVDREAQGELDIAGAIADATGMTADYETHLMIQARAQDIKSEPEAYHVLHAADLDDGSDIVVGLSQTADLEVGMNVAGTGIAGGTRIAEIIDGQSIRLTQAPTADGAGVALTFSLDSHAQEALTVYRAIFRQVQAIRAARDAEIAAFEPPHPEVSPLYPA